jgi:hypothetical protein
MGFSLAVVTLYVCTFQMYNLKGRSQYKKLYSMCGGAENRDFSFRLQYLEHAFSLFDHGPIPLLTGLIAYPCFSRPLDYRGRCYASKYLTHARPQSRCSHVSSIDAVCPCRCLRISTDCSRKSVFNYFQPPRPPHEEIHE